ncbi:MAG: DnaA N-terminal domain-containing protein, partial [Alphaproteobacteria bacterium]
MAADPWQQTLDALQGQLTRVTYDTWLRGSQMVQHDGTSWTVAVRHAYSADWLNSRLSPVVDRTASTVAKPAGQSVHVTFVVMADREPKQLSDAEEGADQGPIMEAVSERRVMLNGDGVAFAFDDYYIKLKLAFRRRALRQLRGAPLSVFLCLALHVDA